MTWTPDRIAAIAGGAALLAGIQVFFFGKRRRAAARSEGRSGGAVTIRVEGGYDQDTIIAPLLASTEKMDGPPLAAKLLDRIPLLRRIPAQVIGMGFRPEHVRSPEAKIPASCLAIPAGLGSRSKAMPAYSRTAFSSNGKP